MTVVVVDDSSTQRRFVRAAVSTDPTLEVVGEARNGRDAVALVERLRPTAVLMDLHLPVMNGIEAIERIMATRPTPIVVYSSFVDGSDRANAASALAAGAIDVMAKPGADDSGRLEEYADALRRRLRVAGRVKVITHPRGRLGQTASTMSTHRLGPTTQTVVGDSAPPRPMAAVPSTHGPVTVPGSGASSGSASGSASIDAIPVRPVRVLAIGASTGGPQAIASLFGDLPDVTDTAIVVIQHMADGFMEGLTTWLDSLCPLPVVLGANGRRLVPGTVTVAPSGCNLIVHDGLRVTTEPPGPGQYHVPGIDATFSSVAAAYGPAAAGLLLTGMGRDGARGLQEIRDGGGITIGQDEATSAVYGMPAAAMALGAVDHQLALPDIGPALHRLLSASAPATAEPS